MRTLNRAVKGLLWVGIAVFALAGFALVLLPEHAAAAVTLDPEEQAALDQLNLERTSRGLNALRVSPTLQAASEWMANDMVGNSTPTSLSHTDSLGRDIRARFSSFGYTAESSIRENIAAGQSTGRQVVQGWMDSPPHRVNNLATDPLVVGIALVVRPGSTFTYYWALAFGSVDDSGVSVTPVVPVVSPTAAVVGITGSVPVSGLALLQTSGAGSPDGVIAGLATRGCTASSIWLVTSATLVGYLVGAPAFVNAAFPVSIAASTPFVAVCR
ncbi:MAG: CAP domain-containing protein [Dehalococcoidia bacterium]|nr:MAG: CAP domain-containing protein [Dehalococcoidia bacterium]